MKRKLTKLLCMSIKRKLLLPILACILVSNVAYTVFWASKHSSALIDAFENEVQLAQRFVGPPVAAAVWDFNGDAALGALQGVGEMKNAVFAQVVVDGESFAETFVVDGRREEFMAGVSSLLEDSEAEKSIEVNQAV